MRLGRDRAIRATRTPNGPATIGLTVEGERLHVEAWGPGADRALDGAPALAGIDDGRDGVKAGLNGHRQERLLDRESFQMLKRCSVNRL